MMIINGGSNDKNDDNNFDDIDDGNDNEPSIFYIHDVNDSGKY